MLRLTKRTEYGLIALVHLAERAAEAPVGQPADVVSARAIGDIFPVPRRLLAEALKVLQASGLLESTRDHVHRFLALEAALEGEPTLTSCAGLGAASSDGGGEGEPGCPIRSPLSRLRAGIWNLLEGVSLQALADRTVDPADLFTAAG